MARDERGKGALGLMGGVLPHQFHVIGCHPPYSCTPKGKRGQRIFNFFTGRSRQCLHTGLSVAHAGAIFIDKKPLSVACDFGRQIVAS